MSNDNIYNPIVEKLFSLFENAGVPYSKYLHKEITSSEEAATVRPNYSIEQGVKALIVCVRKNKDKKFIQIVVPGHKRFSSKKVRRVLNVDSVSFCSPDVLYTITSGVQSGGVPPFGNLFSLPIYADKDIFKNETIIFNCGDRRVSASITSSDYKKILTKYILVVGEYCE